MEFSLFAGSFRKGRIRFLAGKAAADMHGIKFCLTFNHIKDVLVFLNVWFQLMSEFVQRVDTKQSMGRNIAVESNDCSECNTVFRFHLRNSAFGSSTISNAVFKDSFAIQTGISTDTSVGMVQKFFYGNGLVKVAQPLMRSE